MKRKFTKLGGALLALLMVPSVAQAFTDFSVDFRNGAILTSSETSSTTFGVTASGTRVDAGDASSVATITATFHSNEHGVQGFTAVVAVDGPVEITFGACGWGGAVTVKNSSNEDVITDFNTMIESGGKCYHNDPINNIVTKKYVGDATTLTISGGNYVPYFAVKAVDASVAKVTFSKGDVICEGTIVPTGGDYAKGDSYTIPSNFTLYKDGYTLAWTDGINTYEQGEVITLTGDLDLTPAFIANTVSLNDRTAATTVTWDFQSQNGAPKVGWESASGDDRLWIAQATVNGQAIDVKMELDANPGKFNNISWVDWCQINSGTTFTIPAAKGMTINVISMSNQTTSFGGDTSYSGYDESNNITYTYTGAASSLDIVIGNGSYFRTITAVYPAPATVVIPVGSLLHATYYNGTMALTLPANLEAATVDGETSGALTLNWRYGEGDVIPAGTPVILKATTATDYTLTEKIGDATAAPTGNYLYGSDVAVTTTGGGTGAKYYALQDGANGLGFYWMTAEGAAFTSGAHKAWLALPAATPAPFFSLFNDMQTTGVEAVHSSQLTVHSYYDLQGRKVANPTKGLYIVNGKKVAIK